ncbi:hypothetical protein [Streptomyces violascens]|uniref:hypothetical protein n=1 Tax=Streptomyces violascens TaxID=67381 RepID=UPI003682D7F4
MPSTADDQARAAGTQASLNGSSPKGSTPGHPSASGTYRSTPSAPGTDGRHSPEHGNGPLHVALGVHVLPPDLASPSPSAGRSLSVWQASGSYGVGPG